MSFNGFLALHAKKRCFSLFSHLALSLPFGMGFIFPNKGWFGGLEEKVPSPKWWRDWMVGEQLAVRVSGLLDLPNYVCITSCVVIAAGPGSLILPGLGAWRSLFLWGL